MHSRVQGCMDVASSMSRPSVVGRLRLYQALHDVKRRLAKAGTTYAADRAHARRRIAGAPGEAHTVA